MNGATGEIVESYEYEPYGMPTITSLDGSNAAVITASTVGNRFLFTGREWDADAELYHYRFRTYSPREHRFMQSDPTLHADTHEQRDVRTRVIYISTGCEHLVPPPKWWSMQR